VQMGRVRVIDVDGRVRLIGANGESECDRCGQGVMMICMNEDCHLFVHLH
jgi:hypothetical protein